MVGLFHRKSILFWGSDLTQRTQSPVAGPDRVGVKALWISDAGKYKYCFELT